MDNIEKLSDLALCLKRNQLFCEIAYLDDEYKSNLAKINEEMKPVENELKKRGIIQDICTTHYKGRIDSTDAVIHKSGVKNG